MNLKKLAHIISIFILVNSISAQTDTLITNDNNILVGEIKEMVNGVLSMKTSYSDKDFKIEWLEVRKISSSRNYRIILTNRIRLSGTIIMQQSSNNMIVSDEKMGDVKLSTKDIVNIKYIGSGSLLDILNLYLDIGYTFTNTNKLSQFNSSIKGDYYREKWGVLGNYTSIQSVQRGVSPTKRSDASIGYKWIYYNGNFASITGEFFSNNEQSLDLRSNYDISVGRYFVRTNKIYFNSSIGVAYSKENFLEGIQNRESFEGKWQIEYNMFDLGDIDLFTNLTFYPSITEQYRLRTNVDLTAKYDLPRDFYIKFSYNLKYDTKPYDGVEPNDFVFSTGVGWEL